MEDSERTSSAERDAQTERRDTVRDAAESPVPHSKTTVWALGSLFDDIDSTDDDETDPPTEKLISSNETTNHVNGQQSAGNGQHNGNHGQTSGSLFDDGPTAPPIRKVFRPGDDFGNRRKRWRKKPTDTGPTLFDFANEADDSGETASDKSSDHSPPITTPPDDEKTADTNGATEHLSIEFAAGEKAKARDVVAAVRLLKEIEREQRSATASERQTLARFAGFGPVALTIFPNPVNGRFKDANWQALGEELRTLLTNEEYESAKRTTFNAFYTSPTVITAIHFAISRLGIPSRATVLEPGCATGNFMRLAPAEMRFIGVEMDDISGRIAKAIHPDQDIRIENFRDTHLPEASIDAAIGNVPFSDIKLPYGEQKLSLHDFFLAKSVDALKVGGVLAMVTTHFTLDKQNGSIREYLASKADFVGAIRLPSNAFKREGTAVVTDILFLRKRANGQPTNHADDSWTGVTPVEVEGVQIPINRYFVNQPEMILGNLSRKDTLYGGEGYSVVADGDLDANLQTAIKRLPQFAPLKVNNTAFEHPPLTQPRQVEHDYAEGSFVVNEERVICQNANGELIPVVYGGRTLRANGAKTGRRFASLIRLRDLARRVLASQNEGLPKNVRLNARRELNAAYDRFVLTYGPINKTTFSETAAGRTSRRMPNLVKFREDPDAMLVMSLEEYDEATGRAAKAAIMHKDVVGKKPRVTAVESAEEGLLISLDERGGVDIPYIAELYGKPEDDVVAELGDLIFYDPELEKWQTSDAYLSGNVRAKLATALSAGPRYARNADKLRTVQPEDVLPGDIDANLGAPWIPLSDIQAFAVDLFGTEADAIGIAHIEKEAAWSVDGNYSAQLSVAVTSDFGTSRCSGIRLLELALNMKTPVIYDRVVTGDSEERVVNHEETLAAREKQKLIKERFRAWVFSDPERTERLVRLYNDTYNNLRPRLFDGSHLEFPGMNQTIALRAHQRNAIWRCMTAGNTLLAQAVGAGKTFIMAATGMKMKQAAIINKPLYVVPNHMLEQFGREFMQLYPNAKLLIAGKDDLRRERRKMLTAKIASGEWDGIIVTHSSFERIGLSAAYQEQFLRQQIADYERLVCDGATTAGRAERNIIKTIEKQKAAREEKLKNLLAEDKKDDGLVFDELAIDHIFIDEAQYYKNLETPTKMERVAGIQTGGSERAFDLYMKTRYLHEQHAGRGVTFATGTPVSNTMVEMYTLQKYLDSEGLKSRAIDHFDAWAATFGEVVDMMEISPDGKTLRPRSRFARFTNLPELQQMFRAFADVQTADMLDLPRPKLEGGKANVVACPMSDEQSRLQQELVDRYDTLRTQKIDPREDNALAITTDGRKLALDARLLSAEACDFCESKINALTERVFAIWSQTAATRSTQLIFCDMGVHRTSWGYSVYEEIVGKLTNLGIPSAEIAAIGDADSDMKKQALFQRVRGGQVRVLLGSTQKMGTGTNVQKRLKALHHLDAPWKPAEVEQREGRILRQGNENDVVAIYRYVTEGSFDAYMWQALETKAKFITQIMNGDSAVRSAEDIGGQELSYAEVKAIASGNPAVLTLAEADAELKRLSILKKNHADEEFLARRNLRQLPQTISALKERLARLVADGKTLAGHGLDSVFVGGRDCIGDELVDVLNDRLSRFPNNVADVQQCEIGIYRGLHFGLVLRREWAPEVYLEGQTTLHSRLMQRRFGSRALLNALERLANSYEAECDRLREKLAIAEGQLRDYQARNGKSFTHESYLKQLTTIRDQLKACLAGMPSKSPDEPKVDIADLVRQINDLKAAQTIETAPQRVRSNQISAEEPVTARIRQRMNAVVGHSGNRPDERT